MKRKFVELVIFACTKPSDPYSVPLFRYVTRGKLLVRETLEIGTSTVAADIVADPLWTETPRVNSATYHSIVIAGDPEAVARWNRRVVASMIWPETSLKPGFASLKLAPNVRNAFASTTEVIDTSTEADPAASVAWPFWTFGDCGVGVVCSASWL